MKKVLSVGLWIELSSTALSECYGEGIIKWTRQLAEGLCKLPEVSKLLIPAESECIPILKNLLSNRESVLPQKIEFVPLVSYKSLREAVEARALAPVAKSKLVLRKVGASSNPFKWIRICAERAKGRQKLNRKIGVVAETLIKLSTATLRIQYERTKCLIQKSALDLNHLLALNQKKLAADLWIVPNPVWHGVYVHQGKKIVAIPDLANLELDLSVLGQAALNKHYKATRQAVDMSDAVVCFSSHVKQMYLSKVVTDNYKQVRVISHASITAASATAKPVLTKQQLGNRFRKYFSETRFSRFFCDFPLENCEYLFVSSKCRPYKNYLRVLEAYELLLRRQRRNLKLIVTGSLSGDAMLRQILTSRGLVYDVIECTNIDEEFHEGLMANASCLIIPTMSEGGFPFGFCEANRLSVPVAMSRIPVTEEKLGTGLLSPEYFDATSVDDMARAVAFTVDNRKEVVRRQTDLSQTFPKRTWVDVARDFVQCIE